MSDADRTLTSESFAAGGAGLVDFVRSLTRASTVEELERAFVPRFGRLVTAPMYGFHALDREGAEIEHNVGVNVSDVFIGRYLDVMDVDPLLAKSRETGRPVYSGAMMSRAEWEETEAYRGAYATHRMIHVVEAPVVDGDRVVGALHFGTNEPDRSFTETDLRLTAAAADVLAM